MLNKAILMGRLVRDPDKRYTQGNTTVAVFTLAIDRDRADQSGQRQTDFIECVAWGRMADFVCQWFSKGMMAIVCGRIQSRNWEDKNGNKRTSIEVHCAEVSFGETKKAREASGNGSAPRRP
ncbi:MAG: single-stranded DNA-binding protein, partial [Butyricicoccus sp.]|nr:single-stranded DNA-binding protein [Butyricicoccus sp.]